MTPAVFFLVLFAAFLHAVWNGLLKVDGDRLSVMAVIVTVQGVICVVLIGFVAPPDAEGWLFLIPAVLLHTGYRLFLLQAYRFGDLSRIYPIARGSAPLIVTVLAMVFAGEYPSARSLGAMVVVAIGIMSLAFTRGLDPMRDLRAVLLALGTGFFAAAYTVIDGLGARHLDGPTSYMVWVSLLDAVAFLFASFILKRGRMLPIPSKTWMSGAVAGTTAFIAYWIVVWALSVAPMGVVSALRATSIGFAAIFGVVVLKEPIALLKAVAVSAIAAGIAMLKLGE